MDIWHSLILAIIEGVTEFLPVSSTGHLIVASQILGIDNTELNASFSIIIQLAAILAVLANYQEKIRLKYWELWVKIAVSFVPFGVIGFIFADQIKQLFDVQVVAVMFIVGGVIFLWVEKCYDEAKHHLSDIEQVSYRQAIWIGVAQLFAFIPGTSRAGATIVGGLLTGLDRKASAEYSFLLALPVMGAVCGYEFLRHYSEFSKDDLILLAVGFVVSFLVAMVVMKVFISFLSRFTFTGFGIYRIIFGIILLVMTTL